MALSSPLTVIGMVNGMIGGLVLILPVDALHAGFGFSLLVILITGAFSFYSCYLCVIHLGDQKDLDYAMFVHFNKSLFIKILYDLTVFSNLLFLCFLYFQLICIQWQGIVNTDSVINPIVNACVLMALVIVLKYVELGASVMAYGIISIVGYIIFLVWVLASAPSGNRQWEAFGTGEVSLAAAMGGAFAIQTFFIPVLKQNPKPEKYVFFTLLAYIIGSTAYLYIAFMGTFGIINRTPINNDPQDIEAFFKRTDIEVKIVEVIYLVHLYSVFPEFTLISLVKETHGKKIPIKEIIYTVIFVGICLTIRLVEVRIDQIVNLNGSVIGFFFIYFLPAILHIRCLYFSKNKVTFAQKAVLQEERKGRKRQLTTMTTPAPETIRKSLLEVDDSDKKLPENQPKQSDMSQRGIVSKDLDSNTETSNSDDSSQQEKQYFVCDCKRPESLLFRVLEGFLLLFMVGIGAFILVNGLMTTF